MRKITWAIAIMSSIGWAGIVSAAPITDTVTVGGKQWAQPADFKNVSWNEINAVCPAGVCAGTLKGFTMDGWTWAELDAVKELFNTYIAAAGMGTPLSGPYATYFEEDSTWAHAIFLDFRPTGVHQWSAGTERGLDGWHSSPVPGLPEHGGFVWFFDNPEGICATDPPFDCRDYIYTYYAYPKSWIEPYGAFFYRPDADGDGVPDSEDAYPNISLEGRLDTDQDGIPNDCNAACISLGMLADLDDDGDEVIDTSDNCPLKANPNQEDGDGDGIGDICELPPGCGGS